MNYLLKRYANLASGVLVRDRLIQFRMYEGRHQAVVYAPHNGSQAPAFVMQVSNTAREWMVFEIYETEDTITLIRILRRRYPSIARHVGSLRGWITF